MSKNTNGRGQTRRAVVQGAIAGGLATLGLAGTVPFSRARAAADASKWPKDAFSQKTKAELLKSIPHFGAKSYREVAEVLHLLEAKGAEQDAIDEWVEEQFLYHQGDPAR